MKQAFHSLLLVCCLFLPQHPIRRRIVFRFPKAIEIGYMQNQC